MKRGTKVLLIVFIVVAAGLYLYLEVVPKIEGMSENTAVLEYGDLPVFDEAEALIVRDETLFGAKKGGVVAYEQDEGTKVRKGVRIISVDEGPATGATTDAAIGRVRELAGGAMKMTGSFKANGTAVVSYYADGYEGRLTAENVASVTRGDLESCPAKGTSLKAKRVAAGDPVYKLTNNNEWYMVYWIRAEADAERYATGSAVTVSLGGSEIGAEVYGAAPEGGTLKVILRSDMYYRDLARVRKADAKIVFAEYKGLIADRKNVMERDGAPGVFVKQRAGGYKWVPVKILKQTSDKYVLAVDVYYDEAGKQVSTVNYYDEVLADPESEGYE
jgi:putative membrane fusion protein